MIFVGLEERGSASFSTILVCTEKRVLSPSKTVSLVQLGYSNYHIRSTEEDKIQRDDLTVMGILRKKKDFAKALRLIPSLQCTFIHSALMRDFDCFALHV